MVGLPELKVMNSIEFLLKLGFQVFPLSNLTGLTFRKLEIIFKFSYKFLAPAAAQLKTWFSVFIYLFSLGDSDFLCDFNYVMDQKRVFDFQFVQVFLVRKGVMKSMLFMCQAETGSLATF